MWEHPIRLMVDAAAARSGGGRLYEWPPHGLIIQFQSPFGPYKKVRFSGEKVSRPQQYHRGKSAVSGFMLNLQTVQTGKPPYKKVRWLKNFLFFFPQFRNIHSAKHLIAFVDAVLCHCKNNSPVGGMCLGGLERESCFGDQIHPKLCGELEAHAQ